ncbi:endonuclease [Virgibacillus dakarensis]|nr:endonuclease [Virgibacillus dakarensis]
MKYSWEDTSHSFKARIIGKLLGDGSITQQKGRKPRFQYTHCDKDYEWNLYCYKNLKNYIPLNSPKYKKVYDSRLETGFSTSYYTQSRTSDLITYLWKSWYPNLTKQIPFQLLEEYLSTESLAWWYMDDGHLKQKNNKPKKIILSTESFTENENKFLANLLLRKYSLAFKTDKQNRLILYNQFQIYYFLHLVHPYIHNSMFRKTINQFHITFAVKSKRTTLYLSENIHLERPTLEINLALHKLDALIKEYKTGTFYLNYPNVPQQHFTRPYQVIITKENLEKLLFLKEVTGLTSSKLTELTFGI